MIDYIFDLCVRILQALANTAAPEAHGVDR